MNSLHRSWGLGVRTDILIHDFQDQCGSVGLGAVDVRVKLALLVLVVGLNVVLALAWLSALLFAAAIGLVIWSRIPPKLFLLFFLAPAWATLLVFVGFSVGFGETPLWTIGPLSVYQEGMFMGLSAATRVASDMSWMAAVFLTTPFTRVLEGMRWFGIPAIMVDSVAMAYRYTFLLVQEFGVMSEAARSRGNYSSRRRRLRTMSMILAEVLLRAYDRARRIHTAMLSRGAENAPAATPSKADSPQDCPNRCDITPPARRETGAMVQCRGLHYSYPSTQREVLSGIDLAVSPGEVVVVCGPNGSGKSTLLRLMAGLLSPTSGEVHLGGEPLTSARIKEAFRHVGILLQDPNDQLFCTHVWEDVAYGPQNQGLEPGEVDKLVATALDLMGVSALAQRPVHRLSHGEMKKVALAGLLAMRPPLLLLDEPTAGLDPFASSDLVETIEHLNRHHGYAMVIVTHNIDLVPKLAQRMVILDHGCVVADGAARSILTNDELLRKARLQPPILTTLFKRLHSQSLPPDQMPINVEEALSLLKIIEGKNQTQPRRRPS